MKKRNAAEHGDDDHQQEKIDQPAASPPPSIIETRQVEQARRKEFMHGSWRWGISEVDAAGLAEEIDTINLHQQHSGDAGKAHRRGSVALFRCEHEAPQDEKQANSSKLTLTKTMWKPLSDMAVGDAGINEVWERQAGPEPLDIRRRKTDRGSDRSWPGGQAEQAITKTIPEPKIQ
jgi:hypothetical protein